MRKYALIHNYATCCMLSKRVDYGMFDAGDKLWHPNADKYIQVSQDQKVHFGDIVWVKERNEYVNRIVYQLFKTEDPNEAHVMSAYDYWFRYIDGIKTDNLCHLPEELFEI